MPSPSSSKTLGRKLEAGSTLPLWQRHIVGRAMRKLLNRSAIAPRKKAPNRAGIHVVGPRHFGLCLASSQASECSFALVVIELATAAQAHTTGLSSGDASLIQLALELG